MRSGNCAGQQTLTAEAASVLKHSLSLARRRGHAQVTPLHVAATLLGSRTSTLLRRACLKSQQPHQQPSHPLQCRALELCFNVALNRLPTSPTPLLHVQPSLSNALVAALKRAQAHQRRGCIEQQQQQQQPLLIVKVELEQLVISILDDPSVSRVMREAGFCSTTVKNNVEDYYSSASSVFHCYSTSSCGGVFSSPCSPTDHTQNNNFQGNFWKTPVLFSPQKKLDSFKQDAKFVFEVLLGKKRRNSVIVSDSMSITEGIVGEIMGRVKRGEVPDELKSTKFIEFSFTSVSVRFMKREDVEMKISELKSNVDSHVSRGGGVIIYIGDLKWTVNENGHELCKYSAVDRLVEEIAKLVQVDYGSSLVKEKVWIMGSASYQVYMKCQMRKPSLETLWALQAVPVPSAGLGLSLQASSVVDSRNSSAQSLVRALETSSSIGKEEQDKLNCCAECTSSYQKEVQLPSWLQPHSTKSNPMDQSLELRRKWNGICYRLHQNRHTDQNHESSTFHSNQTLTGKSLSYASSYPWWPTHNTVSDYSKSIHFSDPALKPLHCSNRVPQFRRQNSCTIEFNFGENATDQKHEESDMEGRDMKITLALGNSLFSDSGKWTEQKIEKLTRQANVCKILRENVPWQSEIIPCIAESLIEFQCGKEKESCILIHGNDYIGKRRLARAIAESVFGSSNLLLQLNAESEERTSPRDEILKRALKANEKLVILMEDIDSLDLEFTRFLADGKFSSREENISRFLFILAMDDSSSYVRKKKKDSVIQMTLKVNASFAGFNLNHKRKGEWGLPNKNKNSRTDESGGESPIVIANENAKKDFSRQSSFNTVDLNLKADEDEESEEKSLQFRPISSDLSHKTTTDLKSSNCFLHSVKNRFDFNRKPGQDREMTEVFMSKMRSSFEEVCGKKNVCNFSVEEKVLEAILVGSGSFSNSLFDKWLKAVFETSLHTVRFGGMVGMDVRLCLGGNEEQILENGFMGCQLPKKINVS